MFYRKACSLLIGCFWFIISAVFAQEQKVADSLARIYQQNYLTDTARFELLTDLSFNEIRDLNKGLQYAEELINISEQAGNINYLRLGYFLKGTKERLLGNLDEALSAYFKSAEIARKLNHVKGEAYGAIADIYSVADNHSNAIHYYNKAITTLRQSKGDSINLASIISNAGDVYLKTQKYDSALLYFNEAKVIFNKTKYLSGIGYILGNIGMVYANIGKNNLAEKNINEAISIIEETQDYYPICVYLVSMADVYLNKGDKQSALNYTLRSLYLAEQHGLKEQIADASLKLSELYDKAGNTKEAFKNYKKHIAYRDSVNDINTVQKMANLRTHYEISQKQIEVNLLNREKQNQQTILIFLFIILGLTLMLLVTLYWLYKFKSKEEIRLHQQELLHVRLEIQEQTYLNISQELHDNIGQVLSLVLLNINTVNLGNSEAAVRKLAQSKDLLNNAIKDIRDISQTLNADFINDIGIIKAIEQQLQILKRTGIYSTQLLIKGEPYSYGPEPELMIFRIVQELLNNIVKHAEANQINVFMSYETRRLKIKVSDNGKGVDTETQKLSPNKGLGLRNIPNRLKLIKGSVLFESESNKGTTATIEILK